MIYAFVDGPGRMVVQPPRRCSLSFIDSIYIPMCPEQNILHVNRQIYSEYVDHVSDVMRSSFATIRFSSKPNCIPSESQDISFRLLPLLKFVGSVIIALEAYQLAVSPHREKSLEHDLYGFIMRLERVRNIQIDVHLRGRPDRYFMLAPQVKELLNFHPPNFRLVPLGNARTYDKLEKRLRSRWRFVNDEPGVFYCAPPDQEEVFYCRTETWQEGDQNPSVTTYQHPQFNVSSSQATAVSFF